MPEPRPKFYAHETELDGWFVFARADRGGHRIIAKCWSANTARTIAKALNALEDGDSDA